MQFVQSQRALTPRIDRHAWRENYRQRRVETSYVLTHTHTHTHTHREVCEETSGSQHRDGKLHDGNKEMNFKHQTKTMKHGNIKVSQ